MPRATATIWNNPRLNGWSLFALIVVPMCVAVWGAITATDLSSARGVSSMIAFSVRLAVPWLFIAFAASSLAVLIPGGFTRWLLRNRRIMGLCFATGMAWQLLFIVWLVTAHFDYYMAEAYSIYDLAEQVPGYFILLAMTLTSFRSGRSRLTSRQWRMLHKGGIYFLWGVIWSTYWFELYYYDDAQAIDVIYYWMGFAAWGARMAAWVRKRGQPLRASQRMATPPKT